MLNNKILQLKGKFILAVVTGIFLIFVSTLVVGNIFVTIIKEQAMERSHHILSAFTGSLVQNHLSPDVFLEQNIQNRQEKFQEFYQHTLENEEIKQINIFNSAGQKLYASNQDYQEITAIKKQKLTKALSSGKVVGGEIKSSREGDDQLMAIYIPLKSKDGSVYGVVELYHSLNELNSHLSQTAYQIRFILFGSFIILTIFILIWSIIFYQQLKKKNEELIKTQATLKKNIELKKLFISIIDHDLKNPIIVIKGYIDLLKKKNTSAQDLQFLNKMEQSTKRMQNMITDVRLFSQLEDGQYAEKKKEVDLISILKEIISDFQDRDYPDKKVQITMQGCKNCCRLNALPILREVFVNIIDNGIKYGGQLTKIVITFTQQQAGCLISIADNGPGIPDEYKKSIFNRYQRLNKEGVEGTGLGLAIVKHIIELHNGKVWVEDNKGGGAIFKVWLPL
jgi:signal transduction histidine kinase